jgi:ribosome biogenesis GTPase A
MTTTIEESQKQERSHAVDQALGAIVQAKGAIRAYKREDLAGRLEAAKERLEDPAFHVLVVGEFKQGKSSLINALLNAPVCPVDDDIATSAPTAVKDAGVKTVILPTSSALRTQALSSTTRS